MWVHISIFTILPFIICLQDSTTFLPCKASSLIPPFMFPCLLQAEQKFLISLTSSILDLFNLISHFSPTFCPHFKWISKMNYVMIFLSKTMNLIMLLLICLRQKVLNSSAIFFFFLNQGSVTCKQSCIPLPFWTQMHSNIANHCSHLSWLHPQTDWTSTVTWHTLVSLPMYPEVLSYFIIVVNWFHTTQQLSTSSARTRDADPPDSHQDFARFHQQIVMIRCKVFMKIITFKI